MISGAHVILYSKDADADRVFFRNVLGHIDSYRVRINPTRELGSAAGELSTGMRSVDQISNACAMLHDGIRFLFAHAVDAAWTCAHSRVVTDFPRDAP
jgi:hypothetical protein